MKKKMKFSKMIVTLVIVLNVIFTIAVFATFWHVGSEPAELIRMWFAFTSIELLSLSSIRKAKAKADNREDSNYEN